MMACCLTHFIFQTRLRHGSSEAWMEEGGGPDPGRGKVQRLHVHPRGRVQEQQDGVYHEQEIPQRGCRHENGELKNPISCHKICR